jgi:hypothetical protein
MSQLWTGNIEDKSGIATFTYGDVTAEFPLSDVRMFHALCAVINEAIRISAKAERERVYHAIERALKP